MADIARLAGVSVASVSRAMADSTLIPQAQKDRINAIAQEHGYVINQSARNLRKQSTGNIGLVVPLAHETKQKMTDPFMMEMIVLLSEEVFDRGYDVLLSKQPAPKPGWLSALVQSQRFDGLLMIGQSDQHEAINALAEDYAPLVVWGERLKDQIYCSVGVDNIHGGFLATDHLIRSGRSRILFLGKVDVPETAARLEGFYQAHNLAGRSVDPEQVVNTHFTEAQAQATVRALLTKKISFDAIFAGSDVIAMAAMTVLQQFGKRVPGDVAIVGFDDVPLARQSTPSLTTIRQDLRMGAKMMVQSLFERLGGDRVSSSVIPASLIVRDSA